MFRKNSQLRSIVFAFPLLLLGLTLLPPLQVYFDSNSGYSTFVHVGSFIAVLLLNVLTALLIYLEIRASSVYFKCNTMGWLLIFASLVVMINTNEIYVTRLLGAPTLSALFLAFLFSIGAHIWSVRPIYFAAMIVLALVSASVLPTHSDVRLLDVAKSGDSWYGQKENFSVCEMSSDTNCAFITWLSARPDLQAYRDLGRPYPVFFVSAEGGGIYAAAHAFSALDTFSNSCPNFRQHIFSISSVSGGSVGSAAYVASQPDEGPLTEIDRCSASTSERMSAFNKDFLSPILGTFLFANIPNFFTNYWFGLKDSSETLERTFSRELEFSNLDASILDYWRPNGLDPVILLNTTNLSSGRIETASPFPVNRGLTTGSSYNEAYRPNNGMINANLSFISGASLSARFPFLTPSGMLAEELSIEQGELEGTRYNKFVDGGYYDNSGLGVSRQLISDLSSSMNEGLNYNCKEIQDQYCNYILLELDLSRFRAAPSARLSDLPFESDRAFPAQC